MHCDYQLAYCPILQIITYAFRDKAFANTALTPEIIWRLRVPGHVSSLPLQWKAEVLDTPLLRHVKQTEYGLELDDSLPMAYASSREALRELGRDAKFEDDVGHYNYRRWTANEANRKSEKLYYETCKYHLVSNMLSQGTSRARSARGCSVSPVTAFLRGTTNPSLFNVIFKMWCFSGHPRNISFRLLGACSENGICPLPRLN
jgi:Protein of unknown function (DUF3435)